MAKAKIRIVAGFSMRTTKDFNIAQFITDKGYVPLMNKAAVEWQRQVFLPLVKEYYEGLEHHLLPALADMTVTSSKTAAWPGPLALQFPGTRFEAMSVYPGGISGSGRVPWQPYTKRYYGWKSSGKGSSPGHLIYRELSGRTNRFLATGANLNLVARQGFRSQSVIPNRVRSITRKQAAKLMTISGRATYPISVRLAHPDTGLSGFIAEGFAQGAQPNPNLIHRTSRELGILYSFESGVGKMGGPGGGGIGYNRRRHRPIIGATIVGWRRAMDKRLKKLR